jgi:hypothetical protein
MNLEKLNLSEKEILDWLAEKCLTYNINIGFGYAIKEGILGRNKYVIMSDSGEILTDYTDIFEGGIYDGKSEESTASELGSPAKIARKILEDAPVYTKDNHSRLHPPKNYSDTRNLASLSTRFGAYVVDTIIGSIILFVILFAAYLPFSTKETVT